MKVNHWKGSFSGGQRLRFGPEGVTGQEFLREEACASQPCPTSCVKDGGVAGEGGDRGSTYRTHDELVPGNRGHA